MAALVPFILEEALAWAYAEGAYGGLAYTVGVASTGNEFATSMLAAGAMLTSASFTAASALVAGGAGLVGKAAFASNPGKGKTGSAPMPRPKRRKPYDYNVHYVRKHKRFRGSRRV